MLVLTLIDDEVLLGPMYGVPMLLAVASASELPQIRDEGRRLRLRPTSTSAQKEVDKQQGAVLMFGRAGTGKTMCLCE